MRARTILTAMLATALPLPAHAAYGPPDTPPAELREVRPNVWSSHPDAALIPPPPTPDDRACVKRWRSRAMIAHAADVASTIAAIESGRGREVNPLVTIPFGKHPKAHEVIIAKAVMVGGVEILHHRMLRRGDYAGVCRSYKIAAFVVGGVAALNLRVFF